MVILDIPFCNVVYTSHITCRLTTIMTLMTAVPQNNDSVNAL